MTPMFRIAVPVLTLLLAVPGCSAQPFVPMAAPHASPVDRLVAQLEKEESRIEARSRLIVIGAEGVPAMLAHTRHRSAVVRWELANILGPISDARALPALVSNTTADENPHVRWRSLWALSHFEPAAVVEALRAQLAEENELARWNAAMALSFFNIDDGLELIHAGVRNPDPWRRWEAINALGRIHDETSADILAQAMRSPALGDRTEAVLSLGMIGGSKASALLVRALEDPSPDVRWRACLSLGRIGDPATLPALRSLDAVENDPQVREQLKLALAKLSK